MSWMVVAVQQFVRKVWEKKNKTQKKQWGVGRNIQRVHSIDRQVEAWAGDCEWKESEADKDVRYQVIFFNLYLCHLH